jgi:transaldolase
MGPTARLRETGQSLWLDHITRELITSGTLLRYIEELSISGLTSNPTIYLKAIAGSDAYDEQIAQGHDAGDSPEDIYFGLAIEDLRRAADTFRLTHRQTAGVDGYVSLEVSPLLAHDPEATVAQAARLYAQAERPNLLIKIPGTPAGLPAIEESIFGGVPVNVTLLFTPAQYAAALEAYTLGLERRLAVGLPVTVPSVASLFISRWDAAVAEQVPDELRNRLGLAVAGEVYRLYRDFMDSDRWQRLANAGARPQRLLFASTGVKDPAASDVLYVTGLASPHTVTTVPEETLLAFADHGVVTQVLPRDGGNGADVLARFEEHGIDIEALGRRLQDDGATAFVGSWNELIDQISSRRRVVAST